jgi:hypothetical protein
VCKAGALPLEPHLQPFSSLVVFKIGSHFLPRLTWTLILLFMLLTVAGRTSVCHCAQLLVEVGSREVPARTGLALSSSCSQPPK